MSKWTIAAGVGSWAIRPIRSLPGIATRIKSLSKRLWAYITRPESEQEYWDRQW
jgi:hypothetical protein